MDQDKPVRVELQELGQRIATAGGALSFAPQSTVALRHLLSAVETMQLGVIIADDDGAILYANPAQAKLYCVGTPEEIIGKNISIFCLPGYRDPLTPERMDAMRSWQRESLNVREDGSVFPVRLHSDVLRGTDGEPIGVITTCEDLSEIKSEEGERNRLQLQIRQSHTMENLGSLAGGLAHEFKHLLDVVRRGTGPFLEDLPLDGNAVQDRIVEVDTAVHRMSVLVDQLMGYSQRGETGRRSLDLSDQLRGMLRLLEATVDGDVRFQYRLSDELARIDADPFQVQHVVLQLIANAAEAFDGDLGVIQIRTGNLYVDRTVLDRCQVGRNATPGDYVVLEICDDGPGMELEIAAQSFAPFFGTRSTSRGLGLTAAAAIMERHNGAIWLSGRPGEGAHVRLLFPISPRAESLQAAISSIVPALDPPPLEEKSDRARSPRSPTWLPLALGKRCPHCTNATHRVVSDWYSKPVRFLLGRRLSSTRRCARCGWSGFALHRR